MSKMRYSTGLLNTHQSTLSGKSSGCCRIHSQNSFRSSICFCSKTWTFMNLNGVHFKFFFNMSWIVDFGICCNVCMIWRLMGGWVLLGETPDEKERRRKRWRTKITLKSQSSGVQICAIMIPSIHYWAHIHVGQCILRQRKISTRMRVRGRSARGTSFECSATTDEHIVGHPIDELLRSQDHKGGEMWQWE